MAQSNSSRPNIGNTNPSAENTVSDHRMFENPILGLTADHKGNLVLAKASREVVTIEGSTRSISTVFTEQEENSLTIKTVVPSNYYVAPKIFVVAPCLKYLKVIGIGNVLGLALLKVPEFTLEHYGAGDIKLWLDVEFLILNIEGSGNVIPAGRAKKCIITHNGAGDLRAFDLKSEHLELNTWSSGKIEIETDLRLRINSFGSGDIFYKGHPAEIYFNCDGSGQINKIK